MASQRQPPDAALTSLIEAIAARNQSEALRIIRTTPGLARAASPIGATRDAAIDHFFPEIPHYRYGGDTALHMTAAAHQTAIATALIEHNADPRARNRRGAEPLHYAADGSPGAAAPVWNPDGQAGTIAILVEAGADPNALDDGGVAPLHRAVRTRCGPAVVALIAAGADPRLKNHSGSTPLHLAVQTTGRGGSGTAAAREQQAQIVTVLLDHGARLTDKDARGKTVRQSITHSWLTELLAGR